MRVAEVEPVQPLGDDDRPGAVGREVEVVGVATGIGRPGRPVTGLIGVSVLLWSFVTYSRLRSQDGTTCCGSSPTGNCRITRRVAGLITSTVLLPELGT